MFLTVYENGNFFQWSEEERKLKGFSRQTDDEEFEEYLVNRGFSASSSISVGVEMDRLLQIYQSKQGCYMAYAEFDDTITEILILGIGSLLMFLKEYESIFELKSCDYFEIESNKWVRKDSLKRLRISGSYKKDEIVELLGCDLKGCEHTLLSNSRDYIKIRLKEDFGIQT